MQVNDGDRMRHSLIGLLASHDDQEPNEKLARLLETLCSTNDYRDKLADFHFLITGGTYERIITGRDQQYPSLKCVNQKTREFLEERMTVLPSRNHGGVTILAQLITQQKCSIIWPFFTPLTGHWLTPENLALVRLCDQCHVKRLMNTGSVKEWIRWEAMDDANRNLQDCPPEIEFGRDEPHHKEPPIEAIPGSPNKFKDPDQSEILTDIGKMTLALIAHDEMKSRIVEFAYDYESTLKRFKRILATGTTGREIGEAAPSLNDKIYKYHSGPKGGDIEIATEILFGKCHVVIFFIDPLHPHPHIEDIRVVFAACMIQDNVRMLTNELQARAWVEHVIRRQGGKNGAGG